MVVALFFLISGVIIVAKTYWPTNQVIKVNPSFNLPDNIINYTTRNMGTLLPPKRDAEFTIILTAVGGGDVLAGEELLINMTMTASNSLAWHVTAVYANLDSALIYPLQTDPSTGGPMFAYVNLYQSHDHYHWTGTQTIYYSQAGAFGATVIFIRNDTRTAYQNYGTYNGSIGPIIPIASPDTVAAKHNEGLTLGLTCFIIFFAAVDLSVKFETTEPPKRVAESSPEGANQETVEEVLAQGESASAQSKPRTRKRFREMLKRHDTYLIVLVCGLTVALVIRRDSLLGASPTVVDLTLFAIWMALLLTPLFREVNLLGIVTLRKEMADLKTDVKDELLNIRTVIQSSQRMQVYVMPPYPEPRLSVTSEDGSIEEDSQ
jgi:hypothetical protein